MRAFAGVVPAEAILEVIRQAGAVVLGGTPTVYGCVFTSNTSFNAGGAISMSGGLVVNTVCSHNSVTGNYDGGALSQTGGMIRNCLVTGNYAKRWGRGHKG